MAGVGYTAEEKRKKKKKRKAIHTLAERQGRKKRDGRKREKEEGKRSFSSTCGQAGREKRGRKRKRKSCSPWKPPGKKQKRKEMERKRRRLFPLSLPAFAQSGGGRRENCPMVGWKGGKKEEERGKNRKRKGPLLSPSSLIEQ